MKKIFVVLFVLLFSVCPSFAVTEQNNEDDAYYLYECVNLALKNSPVIKQAKYNLEIADKNLNIAKSAYFPTLGAGIQYNQFFNTDRTFDKGYRKSMLPDITVYLQQLIYDFGKTSASVDMRKFNKITAQYEYDNAVNETINRTKLAYFYVLEAQSAIEIEQNNVEISQQICDFTKKQYEKNASTLLDYQDALVHLYDAKIKLQKAENLYNINLANLQNTMYVDEIKDFKIKRINEYFYIDAYFHPEFLREKNDKLLYKRTKDIPHGIDVKYDANLRELPFTFEEAYKSACEKNPKLKALENTLHAMEKQLLYTKRDWFPVLATQVGYRHTNQYVSDIDTVFNDQLKIDVTLGSSVNAMKKKNEIARAKQIINIAQNNIDKFKTDIYYDIEKAYMDTLTAQKQIVNAKDKIESAKKTLETVAQQYITGANLVGYIELQNAKNHYNTAKLEYIDQIRYYSSSLADLEKMCLFRIEYEDRKN